jgi:hypothetical protein
LPRNPLTGGTHVRERHRRHDGILKGQGLRAKGQG